MRLCNQIQNNRKQCAQFKILGETFSSVMDTDWKSGFHGAYVKSPVFIGIELNHLRFGFSQPWNWFSDLQAFETDAGVLVISQGYKDLDGRRIPFMRNRTYFWGNDEMIYEVTEFRHLPKKEYTISGVTPDGIVVDPLLQSVTYQAAGVSICWQFTPAPVYADRNWNTGEWVFEFEGDRIETLIQWSVAECPRFLKFESISANIQILDVVGPRGERAIQSTQKHDCIEPGEMLVLPEGDMLLTGLERVDGRKAFLKNGLWDMAVRRRIDGKVCLGDTRIFVLKKVLETKRFPMFKPYLIRAIRSLKERMLFHVVPEDDPDQYYLWGTGTWPRCFSIMCLDKFGFTDEAYGYLEFMLDNSHQFDEFDGVPHLWDSFSITGNYRGDTLYDINGHSIKLYEAGKFYLNHRGDRYGQKLREEQYNTLKGWCSWIESHVSEEGLVLDITESNVWNRGYGTFTQAPAIAGIKLFINIASDKGMAADVTHFSNLVTKMISGMDAFLFGKGGNPYFNIPDEVGDCYLTYVPYQSFPDLRGNLPKPIGLSCYSLAANYFLQDPEVGILTPDDPKTKATLQLALEHLGDPFDPRIIRWHLPKPHPSHLGYGQGQLLMSLIYAGMHEEFQKRLDGLFDVSVRETGDIYLMQEVLARSGSPNRGNKAHLTYFPVMAAYLVELEEQSGGEGFKFLPDLTINFRKNY